jgi:hypothetical protein
MLRQLLRMASAAVLGAAPLSVHAQPSPSRPAPEQQVRIHLADGSGTVEGRVVGWTADTLVLGRAILNGTVLTTPIRLPRASIVSFQLSLGRDHGAGFPGA